MGKTEAMEATIAAIATPPGRGGIGIIRISGIKAKEILRNLFRPRCATDDFKSHRLYYGWIVDPRSNTELDEVLAVFMAAPATYTREDVVEIHCHGSYILLQDILHLILTLGARLADPGEFTKRAFLNGRIDLTRAEAVLDVIGAKTSTGLRLAIPQLQGELFERMEALRQTLIEVRAIFEVAIDFPDDEQEILAASKLADRLWQEVEEPVSELIVACEQGKIFREGISLVILGRPNVGKSSLLNTLLREERAIVTPVPGTTRDTIEEYFTIKGVPVRLIDTAGIREPIEAIEEIGIRMARERLLDADAVLLVLDASAPLTLEDQEIMAMMGEKPVLLVINKMDLVDRVEPGHYARLFPGKPFVCISVKENQGITALEEAIFELVVGRGKTFEPPASIAPNFRHQVALTNALAAIRAVRAGLLSGLTPDLLAIDLQAALDHLGDIVGETTPEDILQKIFSQFCLGK